MKSAYSNQVINGVMCVWLQDHGWQPARLGADLKQGDVLVYNFGSTAEIISIDSETKATVTVTVKTIKTSGIAGATYTQRISKKSYKPVEVK